MSRMGLPSCATDRVWDAVEQKNHDQMTQPEGEISVARTFSKTSRYKDDETRLGVVIYVLWQGLIVPVNYLREAKKLATRRLRWLKQMKKAEDLAGGRKEEIGWFSWADEIKETAFELKDIEDAIINKGQGVKRDRAPITFDCDSWVYDD